MRMMMQAARSIVLAAAALGGLSACGYPAFQFGEAPDGGEATSSGGTGGGSTTTTTTPTHTTSSGTGGVDGTGGSGGSGGQGGAGGLGGEGGMGGSPPECSYAAPTDCAGAVQLCSVKGDDGSDLCTAEGTTSKWLKVHVDEASGLINQLSFSASLQSPPGMLFDLYVRRDDCNGSAQMGGGNPESVEQTWGDTILHDDGAWVILEVRYFTGNFCGPAAQWTLTVKGHTNP